MNTILKRVISLMLCFVLVAGYLPVGTFATETGETVVTEATEVTEETIQVLSEDAEEPSESTETTEEQSETTEPSTEATVPETTEETVPETSEETVPETTEETVPETTEETVPETTEETVPDIIVEEDTEEVQDEAMMVESRATGDPVVVIAASDYQKSNSSTTMTNIMNQIKEDYSSPYGALLGGDYDAGNTNTTAQHIENVDSTISGVFPNIASDYRIYIQGNHETYAGLKVDGTNLMNETGAHDTDYYGVYAINHDDFPWDYSGSSSTLVQGTADDLKEYLDGKTGYTKPIFVMSHLPLHYTTRGDNDYASLLFDVLNSYDKLSIIFLFGHNHSTAYDSYLGQGSIYLKKGDAIKVAKDDAKSYNDETLNFTYMNYGYVGYIGSTNADATLTMTAFEITDTEVAVKRYSADGQHTLKAAGGNTQLPSGLSVNSDVYGKATINLSTGESTISEISADSGSDDNTGSGDNSGTTGGSGNVYELDTDGIDAGEAYLIVSTGSDGNGSALTNNNGVTAGTDVTISGGKIELTVAGAEWTFSGNEGATATNGIEGYYLYPSTSGQDGEYLIRNEACEELVITGGTNGGYVIARDRGSIGTYYVTYDSSWDVSGSTSDTVYLFKRTGTGTGGGTTGGSTVTPSGGDWVTITSGVGGTIYMLDTDGVSTGEDYLIVSTGTDGTAQALRNNNGSVSSAEVTIANGQIVTDATDIVWTYDSSKYLSNGSHSFYLSYNNATSFLSTSEKRTVAITGNDAGEGAYTVKRDGSYYNYYLNYSNGSWTNGNSADDVYFFVKSGTQAAGDAEYAKLDGELTYTLDRGLDHDAALAEVMKGIDVVVSGDKSAETILDDNNENITWELDSDYDGTVAGEYAVNIYYKEKLLGTARVIVPAVNVDHIACDESGSVKAGATGNVRTGAYITVFYEDDTTQKIPVTLNMLKDADGNAVDTTLAEGETSKTITGLKVYYNGECKCENFTLTVREPSPYPEYPDEGAVKVNKTGTGVQFQSTGVAQVEVSASGIPMNQGVDVLLVLDTSSSMGMEGSLTDGRSRIDVLKECVNALIANLQAERADGSVPDVEMAVVHFNGYTGNKNTNYIGSTARSTSTLGGLLTDGWVDVQNMGSNWAANIPDDCSGTNYDHGLLQAYDLLSARQEAESSRKQFVLFMSDGAPFQYNGVNSNSLSSDWENWILGSYTQAEVEALSNVNNPEFYYGNNSGNGQKHRVAEAIKGTGTFEIVTYSDTSSSGTTKLEEVAGLGITMYSVGLALEGSNMPTDVAGQEAILKTIASSEDVFYSVTSAAGLQEAFDDFAGEVLMAATNARFVDQMGDAYDLQMGTIKDLNGNAVEGVENKIEILSYEIWTRADYLAGKVTADKIGDRKLDSNGNPIATVLETVTFNEDGSVVKSDKASTGPNGETIAAGENILIGGVIYASNFWYNSNPTPVQISGVDIPTSVGSNDLTSGSTNMLPAETFYWKVGTIKTTELAMRYYVYLTGSMEGTCAGGSYPTNEYAILYYNNYLNQPVGQPCHKDTVSPVLAWDAANVSYAFYLVDEDGNIIVNQTTGETGSFANKIAVTNPVVYKEVLLNNVGNVESIEVASLGVLPEGYELYDNAAVYTVQIKSDATGSWTIVKGTDKKSSTYVTHFNLQDSSAYTNELTKNSDADFTHTVVWFAVLWKVQALPDSVVVDYGLPVDISVLSNDMFGEAGKLVGVGSVAAATMDGHTESMNAGFGDEYKLDASATDDLKYGDASVGSNDKVRYTLKTMQMDGYDKFAYAVNYTGATNPGYYYDTVTVIPATTIYYEDSFVEFDNLIWQQKEGGKDWEGDWAVVENPAKSIWSPVGNTVEDATQAEDRPGKYALQDANNIYGYDAVNKEMSTYSLGSAMKATVDYDNAAQASFTFIGTGFDVISMTNNTTGTILVKVYSGTDLSAATEKNLTVDTYYGYTKDENGNWVVNPDAEDSLYQVPVMKVENLEYGQYTAVIQAVYDSAFDHNTTDATYDFYLDAIRIYDPANDGAVDNDTVIEDAYKADGEGWPDYMELRNNLISAETLDNDKENKNNIIIGEVFIDGDATIGDAQIEDYISYGPNNEVYLSKNQSVAFLLSVPANIANVHIGAKSADGNEVTYTIQNIAQNSNTETDVKAGDKYHEKVSTINTTTDMYYDMTDWSKDIIVITNTGSSGILSLTNLKFTYTSAPVISGDDSEDTEDTASGYAYITPAAATLTLRSMNNQLVEEPDDGTTEEPTTEPSVPETSEPEETEPVKPSKSDLKDAVAEAKKLREKDYTKSSFKSLKSAIKAAEKVLKNKKATDTQIEAALDALNAAVEALEAKPDSAALKKAVDAAKKLKEKNYTKDSFKTFKAALKAAQKVLKDGNATQAEIDEALSDLNEAMEALVKKSSGAKPGKKR